jgi:uncharacterized protein (DUF4415 family)
MASEPTVAPDPDNPEWTAEDFARARPAGQVLPPVLYDALTRRPGRPKTERPKRIVTIRLDQDVLDHFRAQGKGWQSRVNAALRKAAGV